MKERACANPSCGCPAAGFARRYCTVCEPAYHAGIRDAQTPEPVVGSVWVDSGGIAWMRFDTGRPACWVSCESNPGQNTVLITWESLLRFRGGGLLYEPAAAK